jgi:hypothetical protein
MPSIVYQPIVLTTVVARPIEEEFVAAKLMEETGGIEIFAGKIKPAITPPPIPQDEPGLPQEYEDDGPSPAQLGPPPLKQPAVPMPLPEELGYPAVREDENLDAPSRRVRLLRATQDPDDDLPITAVASFPDDDEATDSSRSVPRPMLTPVVGSSQDEELLLLLDEDEGVLNVGRAQPPKGRVTAGTVEDEIAFPAAPGEESDGAAPPPAARLRGRVADPEDELPATVAPSFPGEDDAAAPQPATRLRSKAPEDQGEELPALPGEETDQAPARAVQAPRLRLLEPEPEALPSAPLDDALEPVQAARPVQLRAVPASEPVETVPPPFIGPVAGEESSEGAQRPKRSWWRLLTRWWIPEDSDRISRVWVPYVTVQFDDAAPTAAFDSSETAAFADNESWGVEFE